MHLNTYKEVAAAVIAGRKVVCRVDNTTMRRDTAHAVMDEIKAEWGFSLQRPSRLTCGGDGLLHMVTRTDQVRGMEYHDSIGWIGEDVAARVRLT